MLANIVSVNVNLRQVCTKQLLCLTSRFESVCVCVRACVCQYNAQNIVYFPHLKYTKKH